jgi:hypothetical protein
MVSDEHFVDVTLACEGIQIRAHKMVLSACSNYFKEIFLANPCKHPVVILKDMKFEDLRAIVDFMYKGEVNVSQNQLGALLKTAEVLRVKGLTEVNESDAEKCSSGSEHRGVQDGVVGMMNGMSSGHQSDSAPATDRFPDELSSIHNVQPAVAVPTIVTQKRKRKKRVKREPVAVPPTPVLPLAIASTLPTPMVNEYLQEEEEQSQLQREGQLQQHHGQMMPGDSEEEIDIAATQAKRANLSSIDGTSLPMMSSSDHQNHTNGGGDQTPLNVQHIRTARRPAVSKPDLNASESGLGDGDGYSDNESAENWALAQVHQHHGHHDMDDEEHDMDRDMDDSDGMIDVKPIISFDDGSGASNNNTLDIANMSQSSQQMTPDGSMSGGNGQLVPAGDGSTGKICVCHLCHLTFTAYSSLRRHMTRHYADRERYECDICFKSYSRKDYLKEHKKLKHAIN